MKPKTSCLTWQKPPFKTYNYNLAIGEQYFGPLVSYARTAASERGPAPGALTYGERLHLSWAAGQRQSQPSPDCRPADTEDGVEPHLAAHRALLAAHQASLEAGRASSSRAVRRAERHAAASGRDPRHEVTARPRTEVTALAVAARLAPPQGRHLATQLAARSRGGARVRRLVRELEAVTRAAVMAGGGTRGGGRYQL